MVNRITSSWCQICPQWEPLRLLRALAPSDWAATHKQHIRLIWMIIPLGIGQHQYSNSSITQGERQHLGESDAAVLFVLMSVKLQVWAHFVECTCSTNAAATGVCKAKTTIITVIMWTRQGRWGVSSDFQLKQNTQRYWIQRFGSESCRRPETRPGRGDPRDGGWCVYLETFSPQPAASAQLRDVCLAKELLGKHRRCQVGKCQGSLSAYSAPKSTSRCAICFMPRWHYSFISLAH